MGSRLPSGIAALLVTVLAGGIQTAPAAEPGRLAAFSARQSLRNEVCVAMADGSISRAERYAILTHAKTILTPEEYQGLKRSMDRLSPPPSVAAKHLVQVVKTNPPPAAPEEAPPVAEASLTLTIPADVSLPE